MSKKMAKFLSVLLLALAVAVTQVPVSDAEAVAPASDFQVEGNKLLKYAGSAEAVTIPEGIKEIGEEAFAGNDNLVKVTIGGQVEKIGYRAFADCKNLRTINVGDSVTEVEVAAFSNNRELRNVTLGTGLKKVGSGIFAGCGNLSGLNLKDGNPYLTYSDGILYDDEKTILYAMMPAYEREAITLPESLEEISAYAFWGNPYLRHVTFDSNIKNIPAYAFSNCLNLESVSIPLPVRSIEAKAFEDCVNLTLVSLPDSMVNINSTAFDGCYRVEFEAKPGTYGAEFAALFKASEVDRVEYEDVQDSQVISSEDVILPETTGEDAVSEETSGEDALEATPVPEEQPLPPESPITIGESTGTGRLLGESSIVAGRAVVFIDNGQGVMSGQDQRPRIDLGTENTSAAQQGEQLEKATEDSGSEGRETIGEILFEDAAKGENFPKYTVVGTKIAAQAYYQDADLEEYEIEPGITEIGDFSFARSNLAQIVIPEGVEKIGYGAFYHCDELSSVTIPESVKQIEGNAFAKTPWLAAQTDSFVVAGDGILIAYSGKDSVVNIPDNVKQIGAEVFKDHMGITAVNIPDSVTVIGEAAFSGCKNLKTVNGGRNLVKAEDRAFFDCPLSQVVIPASMEEIGLGAYALSGGTDTVVFEGERLPVLTVGDGAKRLSNEAARVYAFGDCKEAHVPDGVLEFAGTVLESGKLGFHGIVYYEQGGVAADLTAAGEEQEAQDGIEVRIESQRLSSPGGGIMAELPGSSGSFVLRITDSEEAAERITAGYRELYGGREPSGLLGLDITLSDRAGDIPITKLGKQSATVQIPKPESIGTEGLHMVTLDDDGQLEAVPYQIVSLEDGDYIQFTAKHFSPYGIYQYSSGIYGQGTVQNGSAYIAMGSKDDTPDTGDGIHPKWFLASGLFAAAVAMFFFRGKRKTL